MARVRALEELEAALTEDLKWRTQEVTSWEAVAKRAREHELPSVVRGGLALLYGHWEGYVKSAVSFYLEYVARKGLKLNELRPELAAVAMRTALGHGEQSKRAADHTAIVLAVREHGGRKARMPYDRATVRTYSNLNFDRFEDIMHSIGCDGAAYKIYKATIDNRLLRSRNEIAHGREHYITLDDWRDVKKRVFEILHDVRSQVSNSAATQAYRRRNVTSPSRTTR